MEDALTRWSTISFSRKILHGGSFYFARHNFGVFFFPLVKLLFSMFPCKFQPGTDSSYDVRRSVEVIPTHCSVMTTEPVINLSVSVWLLFFIFGLFDRNLITCKQH